MDDRTAPDCTLAQSSLKRNALTFQVATLALCLVWSVFLYPLGFIGAVYSNLVASTAFLISIVWVRPRVSVVTFAVVGIAVSMGDLFLLSLFTAVQGPSAMAYFVLAPIFGWILGSARYARILSVASIALMAASMVVVSTVDVSALTGDVDRTHALLMNGAQGATMVLLAYVAMNMLNDNHTALVTQLRQQRDELEAANRALAASQRYRDRFFAAVSHELRTPMNAVVGIADLLDSSNTAEDRAHLHELLRSSSRHLLGIINDLLDLTKLKENKLALVSHPFDLHQVLAESMEIVRRAHPTGGAVELTSELGPDLPRWVSGDPRRLTQVLVNLLTNAMKFTHVGTVKLRGRAQAHGDARKLELAVVDTGIGITPEALRHLFQDFTQADEHIGHRYGGTGMGLAISRRLTELMGGTLTCTSEPGRGSTFTLSVTLPVARSRPTRSSVAAPTAALGHAVLVVDDNRVNRFVLRRQLERRFPGVQIDEATNGAEAVDKVRAGEFDLVFLDIQMPVMDGLEAARKIRALPGDERAHVPIVAMTAAADSADLASCLASGMNHALGKPVASSVVERIVAEVLGLNPALDSDPTLPAVSDPSASPA